MNILIDLLGIVPTRSGGTETYVDGLLREMNRLPETNLLCLTNESNHHYYRQEMGLPCRATPVDGRNRVTRLLYQQLAVGSVARETGADVLFCPLYLAPVWPTLPTVVVIHDANFRDIPTSMPTGVRLAYRLLMPPLARSATRIVTVSEFSKQRIRQALNVEDDRIAVIHEGPLAMAEHVAPCDWNELKSKYGIRGECFLSISSGMPHKNIVRLVQAFVEMKEQRPGNQQLVLLGHPLSADMEAPLQSAGLREDVIAPGFVSASEKLSFLRNSLAYCQPSLYEGFGLPVLEAQSCGLPVAASTCASLPEVGGEGALYFDALSVKSIAEALLLLVENPAQRQCLVRKGFENLRRFSWHTAAIETRRVLGEAAQGPPAKRPWADGSRPANGQQDNRH